MENIGKNIKELKALMLKELKTSFILSLNRIL